jgi:hypothetical protein
MAFHFGYGSESSRHDGTRQVLTDGRDLESLEDVLKALRPAFQNAKTAARKASAFMDARTAARLKSDKARRRGKQRTLKGKPVRAASD